MHLTVRGELYRVVTVKACFAKWKIPGHLLQVLQLHVTEESAPIEAQISAAVWEDAIN